MQSTPNSSVDAFHERVQAMTAEALSLTRQGKVYPQQAELHRLTRYGQLLTDAAETIRGGFVKRNGIQEERQPATEQERRAIQQFQIDVARIANGDARATLSTAGLPTALQHDVQEWVGRTAWTATESPLLVRQRGETTDQFRTRQDNHRAQLEQAQQVIREVGWSREETRGALVDLIRAHHRQMQGGATAQRVGRLR